MTKLKMDPTDARFTISMYHGWDHNEKGKTPEAEAVFEERRKLIKAAYACLRGEEASPVLVTPNPLGPAAPATYRDGDTLLQRLDEQAGKLIALTHAVDKLQAAKPRWWAIMLLGCGGAVLGEYLVDLLRWLAT